MLRPTRRRGLQLRLTKWPRVLGSFLIVVVIMLMSGTAVGSTTGRSSGASLIVEPNDGFASVYRFVSGARNSVDVEMYELNDTTFERDLVADVDRGVWVRVILDRAYEGAEHNASAFGYLSLHHVPVRWAPSGTIVHEKAIVVDNKRALIATFNLDDTSNYYATTRDFGVFDSASSDVRAIDRVFDADWSGAPISRPPASDDGSDLVWSPGSEPVLGALIRSARHSLLVENEETDDSSITAGLVAAARRGVNVEVVMTLDSTWTSAFDELKRAGVRVATYDYDATPYIHAKVVIADADTRTEKMFLGSENFSVTSLDYNRELGLITKNASLIALAVRTVRSDFAGAKPW